MRARPCPDPLAVWTVEEAGEDIPNGDPSVTDAERAAAGRETLAERFAAVLPGNRRRAAERYTAGGLPDGEDVARVWRPRDPAGLRARLTEPPLAIWSSGDVLEVLWQGQADEVQLYGGVQPRLWPVEETDDLWEVSLRIRGLDQAVISVTVASRQAGGDWPRQIPDVRVWRGPRAPAAAAPRELRGSVSTFTLLSTALRGERKLTVYQPPGAGRPVPGCVLADGESVQGFAPTLESAIEAGAVPPVLLVGLHNAPGALTPVSDLRAQEYLPGYNRRRFDAHLLFVTSEVLPWADERFGPVAGPWVAAGFSNGAAWAIAAAQPAPGPDRRGGRAQRWRRPAADPQRGPFGRRPALSRGRHARARVPPVHQGMGRAAEPGRARLSARGMDRRPRPGVVGAAASGRARLAAPGLGRDDHGPDGQDHPDDDEHGDYGHGHRAADEDGGQHAHVRHHRHARPPGDGGVHRDPTSRPGGRAVRQGPDQLGRDVGSDRGQLRVGARRERPADPRVEFVPGQPTLHERGLEQADHPLAVGTRGP
jgi:hypothetical protein